MNDPATTPMQPEPASAAIPADGSPGDDLAAIRALVLRAHPDTVAELIAGETMAALLASIEPARAAYRRVVDAAIPPARASGQTGQTTMVPAVPAGAFPAPVVDPALLPPTEKIRRGLAARG